MNRALLGIGLWMLGTMAGSTPIEAKQPEWKVSLKDKFLAEYTLTEVASLDLGKIREAGEVFVIQQDGVLGASANQTDKVVTQIEGGRLAQPFFTAKESHEFQAGERIYIRRVKIEADKIDLTILTCDSHKMEVDGETEITRYSGVLRFVFPKGELPGMSFQDVKAVVDSILLEESEAAAANTQTVRLGQTRKEIESILGSPNKIIDLGEKITYVYDDIKVIFVDGKVSDVQ